jgi:hypothetical protein
LGAEFPIPSWHGASLVPVYHESLARQFLSEGMFDSASLQESTMKAPGGIPRESLTAKMWVVKLS